MKSLSNKTISDCFELVAQCGNELVGIRDALNNMFSEEFSSKHNDFPFSPEGDFVQSERFDDSGWLYTDEAQSIGLKAKGKRKIERYIGYQISMTGDGILVPSYNEPLLHVFCWEHPCDFDEGDYVGCSAWEDDENSPLSIAENRLLYWGSLDESGWNECEWTFTLRLMALNTPDDLKKYVIQPAFALLKGVNICTALPVEWFENILVCPVKELVITK
jgi:hypothetical protein